jgi:hypothetical protein
LQCSLQVLRYCLPCCYQVRAALRIGHEQHNVTYAEKSAGIDDELVPRALHQSNKSRQSYKHRAGLRTGSHPDGLQQL